MSEEKKPICFGELYDDTDKDCKACTLHDECAIAFETKDQIEAGPDSIEVTPAPEPEPTPIEVTPTPEPEPTPIEVTPTPEPEPTPTPNKPKPKTKAKDQPKPKDKAATVDPATVDPALENEVDAAIEVAEAVEEKKKAAPKKESGSKKSGALKTISFKTDPDSKKLVVADEKEAELTFSKGDTVKINNERSKFNGREGTFMSFSPKYNEVSVKYDEGTSLHRPDHILLVTAAS